VSLTHVKPPIWLQIFQPVIQRLNANGCWVDHANALLQDRTNSAHRSVSGGGQALQFRQSLLDETVAYEPGIFESGQVPCRTVAGGFSLAQERHDYYNALVWLTFPKSKARLNQLSMLALDAFRSEQVYSRDQASAKNAGAVGHRGPLRDAITVFDENALLLLSSDSQLIEQLATMQWQNLLVAQRSKWLSEETIVPVCFGHALLQKLEAPYKAITGHSFVISMTSKQVIESRKNVGLIDTVLCEQLSKDVLVAKPFLPLPVLGIPEWSFENTNLDYYDDPQVFRKRKVTLRTV
jgi:Protein of unknown function (DUF3025)